MTVDAEDPLEPAALFDDGALTLDFIHGKATFDGKPVVLLPIEYSLLVALVRHEGQILSSRELCELAGVDVPLSRGNTSMIKGPMVRLRDKLALGWGWSDEDSPIELVRGRGWRYRSLNP